MGTLQKCAILLTHYARRGFVCVHFKKVYVFARKNRTFKRSFYGENFQKLDIDNLMDLWYIINKFLHWLFCKNVHISVNRVTYNKVAFFVCPADARHCVVCHGIKTTSHADTPCQRHVRGLIVLVRDLIATPRPHMTSWRRVAMLWRTRASVSVTLMSASCVQRHVLDLIAVVRNPIATPRLRMTLYRREVAPRAYAPLCP